MNFYVVVQQTKHIDYTCMSGYAIEAVSQQEAEREAQRMFSDDTGYAIENTEVAWVKVNKEARIININRKPE